MKIDPKLPESEIDFSEYSEEEVHEYYLEQTDAYGDDIMEKPVDWDERPWELLGGITTVCSQDKPAIRIVVNPDYTRKAIPYFKAFDTQGLKDNITKVTRLHFLDTGMEYHRDAYKDWKLNSEDIKNIKELLMSSHYDYDEYTNWQMACWLWNLEYGLFSTFDLDDYFAGKLDDQFKGDPSYVPSTTQMPDTWIYDPNGAKKKRK